MDISDDYIRGLVEGEGCFTFCTVPVTHPAIAKKLKLPAFALRMHERDKDLIIAVRNKLGLKNRVLRYRGVSLHANGKIYKRGFQVLFIVRDLGQLKNKIIPFFYRRLVGHKGKQFFDWLENIGNDPLVHDNYKLLYRLYKSGYWDRKVV